ncbi:MAG: YesL family protein [Lachnospiraceae bacterium]|nr:YesL family protein [Lachnospiraceae bacterium]
MEKDKNIEKETPQPKGPVYDDQEGAAEELTIRQKLLGAFDRFGDLFMLNVYFSISCVPIITIGAAFTALYTVTNKMRADKDGRLFREYLKAFRENLKPGIIIFCADLVLIALVMILSQRPSFLIISGILFFLLSFAIPLQFPLLARYKNTPLRIMLNALALCVAHPLIWFKLYFIWMLPVVVYYFYPRIMLYTWYLWTLILTALFAYICSGFLLKFYEKIEAEDPTGQENK